MYVFTWHARFKPGRTSDDDNDHTGRPFACTAPKNDTEIQERHWLESTSDHSRVCEVVGIGFCDIPDDSH